MQSASTGRTTPGVFREHDCAALIVAVLCGVTCERANPACGRYCYTSQIQGNPAWINHPLDVFTCDRAWTKRAVASDSQRDSNAMNHTDEPLFKRSDLSESPGTMATPAVRERIRQLIDKQPYAVLCVQGSGQPYGALVAFAFSEDMQHAVFVTPIATRKYRLLRECDHVALVIDNRPDRLDELMEIEAVTVTGQSQMIERGDEFEHWSGLLIARHPYLKSFVNASTCALFRVDVVRFLHVGRFQEVNQWLPGDRC